MTKRPASPSSPARQPAPGQVRPVAATQLANVCPPRFVAASRRPAGYPPDNMPSLPLPALRTAFLSPLAAIFALLSIAPGCTRQTHEPFPVSTYLDAPDNLQGNRYTLDAEIETQLEWKEGVGRLLAVHPLAAEAGVRLPVFIADSLQANLMTAQRYRLELTVRRGGLLYVNALRKL